MPRQARLDAPGTLHHVMIRGIDGLVLFRNDQDREDFISRMSQLVESTETKILAWAIGLGDVVENYHFTSKWRGRWF